MKKFILKHRRIFIILLHTVLIAGVYVFAFILRFDGRLTRDHLRMILYTLPVVVTLKLGVFSYYNLHRGLWRYASVDDLVRIAKACTVSGILLPAILFFFFRLESFPRSVFIIDWVGCIFVCGGKRFAVRLSRERGLLSQAPKRFGRHALIVGAGDAGAAAVRELARQVPVTHDILGFVDDDPQKQKMILHGYPVLGTLQAVPELVRENGIEDVIIAMPSASKSTIRKVVESCSSMNVKFRILPAMVDLISGRVNIQSMREVRVEDLLGRDPVKLDREPVFQQLEGKVVLVTGAGGSIGSELVRQIAAYNPARLALLEVGETPLFNIDRELARIAPDIPRSAFICDIKHRDTIEQVFRGCRPDFVFHAAAYKHVPLMEEHPDEAVLNNVRGTQNVAEVAAEFGVEKFVMISTDKAVRPTSVMGATKRCAELVISSLNASSNTCFAAVRFGNVLGSNGSVVPIFRQQIEQGGPVTVTDPEMTRFFMTIPEAVELVLQAATISRGGEVFVLDMGEPVKIVELARNMIELSGLEVGKDIKITYTGLRPGEKLYEELVAYGEDVSSTKIQKIMVHHAAPPLNGLKKQVLPRINELCGIALSRDVNRTHRQLWELVQAHDPDALVPQNALELAAVNN